MAAIVAKVGQAIAAAVAFTYGFLYLTLASAYSFRQKEYWSRPSDDEKAAIARALKDLWSLSHQSGPLVHDFVQLPSGKRLHYLTPRQSPDSPASLLILVHGFPDSAHLFARQLRSGLSARSRVVALDLPGCGGSDDLEKYGPDQVLNAVASAIVQLKTQFLGPHCKQKCILVGHDWGGVVAFRIAAETAGLVNHVVTINSLYPAYAEETLKRHLSQGFELLKAGRFSDAGKELSPVWSQIRKSGYTYMLTLPFPIAKRLPRVAACLVKYLHGVQYKATAEAYPAAARLAMAYGPGPAECETSTVGGQKYGPSVLARSSTDPPGDWDQKVRLYAEGLLREAWTPSYLEDLAAHPGETSAQKFKCPVNIIFGMKDIALDPRVVLDGIEKYFIEEDSAVADAMAEATRGTERILRLPECGHWSILEEECVMALDRVLQEIV